MNPLLIVPFLLLVLAAGLALGANRRDREAIRRHVAEGGGRVLWVRWWPLGRVYRVLWKDRHGAPHASVCRSTLLTPVRWTEGTPPPRART